MNKLYPILFFFLIAAYSASHANECYISYGNMPKNVGIDDPILKQSFTCTAYQDELVNLFRDSDFDNKLSQLQKKYDRVNKALDELDKQIEKEIVRTGKATLEELQALLEAIKDTLEMTGRCVNAIRFPKNSRKVYKCIEEIDEANASTREFIEKFGEAETERALLKTSLELQKEFKSMKKEWEEQKKLPEKQKEEFLRRCAVLRGNCVTGSTLKIEVNLM